MTEITKDWLILFQQLKDSLFSKRVHARNMSKEEFINEKASGTLRKNSRLGFDYVRQYLDERTSYEFGFGFEIRNQKQVTIGKPITESDAHSITETGWHAERYLSTLLFPGDEAKVAYITVEVMGRKREGVGIIITKTSVPWVEEMSNTDVVIFSIVAEYDASIKDYKPAINPC